MKTPSVGNITFADIAKMLKNKAFARDVEELGLAGKEINAETVEKAFMDSPKAKGQTSEEVLAQIRSEVSEAVRAMNLPFDTSLEELGLKTLAAKKGYKVEHLKPIEAKKLDITSK